MHTSSKLNGFVKKLLLSVLSKQPTFSALFTFYPSLEEAWNVARIFFIHYENNTLNYETRELANNEISA